METATAPKKRAPEYNPVELISQFTALQSERKTRDATLQQVAYYCLPYKAYITRQKVVKGERLPSDIYDSTAIDSAVILAAAIHGYLTNPSSRWFTLKMQDPKMQDNANVRNWLKQVENRMYDILNDSNFNQQINELYLDMGVFGTGVMFCEEDDEDVVRFACRPINEIFIVEDSRERVKTIFRWFRFTTLQAIDAFGDKAGPQVREAFNKKDFTRQFEFLHHICPRYKRSAGKTDAKNKPFASYYISMADKIFVKEGGYDEFPAFVPRYNKVSDDAYGYSPAVICLADIKMLNKTQETFVRAGEKAIDPPLVLPHDGFILPIKLNAAALNYRLPGTTPTDKIEQLPQSQGLPFTMDWIKYQQEAIKRKFHTDLFLMLIDSGDMTATEVMQRVQEKMLILGPTIGRLMTELLNPMIHRVFAIMMRRPGLIPPPPAGLQNANYVVDYVSPLAQAQKSVDTQSITSLLQIIQQIVEFVPGAQYKLNSNKAIDHLADVLGTPPDVINDDETAAALAQEAQKQQMQEMQLQQAQTAADVVAKGAKAHKDMATAK